MGVEGDSVRCVWIRTPVLSHSLRVLNEPTANKSPADTQEY